MVAGTIESLATAAGYSEDDMDVLHSAAVQGFEFDPDVVADAKQLVQRIRAELALRPTERYLREHLASGGN